MGYSITARDAFLNTFRGTAMAAQVTPLYVELFTTNPSDDTGTGAVEVSTSTWTNYARQSVASTTAGWAAPAGGTTSPQSISNAALVDFGTATISGTAPVITGFGLRDASSAGNLVAWSPLSSNQTISNGDPVNFPIGNLVLQG